MSEWIPNNELVDTHKRVNGIKVYRHEVSDRAAPSRLTAGGKRVSDLTPAEAMEELVHLATESTRPADRLTALKMICQIKGMLKDVEPMERTEPIIIIDEEGRKIMELGRKRKSRLDKIAEQAAKGTNHADNKVA